MLIKKSGNSFFISLLVLATILAFAFCGPLPVSAQDDTSTWIPQTSGVSSQLNDITYAEGLFVAVGDKGVILTSEDGKTWTQRTSNAVLNENINSVTYGNGKFVACTSGNGQSVIWSADGITWTRKDGNISSYPLWDIAYGNETFVMVGSYYRIYTSTDGLTWTRRTKEDIVGRNIKSIAYGDGKFVAPFQANIIFVSKDNGVTWETTSTESAINQNIDSAGYGNGKFIIGGSTGTFVASSGEGLSWTIQKTPVHTGLYDAVYADELYIMVGKNYWPAEPDRFTILASNDGVNWYVQPVSGTAKDLYGVTYGNGIFVAVGAEGTILTSSVSGKARLNSLQVGDGVLRPGFYGLGMNYMTYVDYASESTTVTAIADSAGDTITINGEPQESGTPKTINLSPGGNKVTIIVTSADTTVQNTYTLMINRLEKGLIAAGEHHALALKPDGTVVAWGYQEYGETTVPEDLSDAVCVATGTYHSLAEKSDGTVIGWGSNSYLQTEAPSNVKNPVSIDAGLRFSQALMPDGTVINWGSSSNNPPSDIPEILELDAGGSHSIALANDGYMTCWGDNYQNKAKVPEGLSDVVSVSAGGDHSLALKADGTVMAWGYNNQGQINVPAGLMNVISISAGGHHSVALKADGTVEVWGGTQNASTYTVPAGLDDVIEISAGEMYTMALKADGTLVVWGTGRPVKDMPEGLNLITPSLVTPSITSQPADLTVTAGQTATFTVSATGDTPLSYQWKKDGNILTDGGNISGATEATLTITNAQASDAGNYTCYVSNGAGDTTSDAATLTVNTAPPGNTVPNRKSGVPATATASVTVNNAYTLDISTIFEDADGDPLNYKVSVNNAAMVGSNKDYSYTPNMAGITTLVFAANDGKADSTDTYTVTLTAQEPQVPTYTLAITAGTGGSITTGSSGNYAAGKVIPITATPSSGYSFNKWTSTGGGTFADANNASTTYTMPANAATITATFTYNSSSGGNSGGSSGSSSTTPTGILVTSSGKTASVNEVTVTFPGGAVENDIRVQIKETGLSKGMSLPDDGKLLSQIIDIIKDKSGNFKKTVTITLSFNKSVFNPDEHDITIYYYDEDTGKWIALDNIRLNLEAGTISGDTTHFTKFAVIATPKVIKEEKPVKPGTPQPVINIPGDISGHWAKDSILKLTNAGVVSGYPDGTFKPTNTVTRAEFTVMLVKALNLETRVGKTFNDTNSHWAKDSISTAAAYDIISGYNENTFGPNDLITREQAAVIIARAAQLETATDELNFADSKAISSWAKPGVAAAFNSRFITGYPDNSFKPQGKTTRAEAAIIIGKLLQ